MKKHKISETSKAQNDYSNSNNIDIIGIDETKSISVPVRDDVPDNKIQINSVNRNDIFDDNKDFKHDHQYASTVPCESLHCSICGEIFHYMAPLAQHYLIHHKGI